MWFVFLDGYLRLSSEGVCQYGLVCSYSVPYDEWQH